ncbi:MAG: putative Zn finger protein, partial [Rhodothermales bacterium]
KCPDWASMCKHVAAVLYGVGNRLDTEPEMLFTLRQVTLEELLARSIEAATSGLLARADVSSEDVLDDADLGDVFGIEMEAGDFSNVSLPAPAALPECLPAPASEGAPQHGKMREQFMRAIAPISGEIRQANARTALPDWTRNQVAGCIQRLVADGELRRVRHGRFEKAGR